MEYEEEEIEPGQTEKTKSDADSDASNEGGVEAGDVLQKLRLVGESDFQASTERVTPPFLTKYEKTRVIGTRALQISKNAPVLVDLGKDDINPLLIAEKELTERKIPFVIRRYLPDGAFEDWRVSELAILDRY